MVLSSGCRLLIGMFGFAALAAVIMNKAMSLIVVLSALPARLVSVPWSHNTPLAERKSRPVPNVVGPVEGPTEPKLTAVEPRHPRKMTPDQG